MASRGTTIEIVFDHFPRLAAALAPAAREIVQETIFAIETGAKIKCPVDTGALRASIQSEMTGETAGQVATNIEYSKFVEYGTSRMAAQPWLTPAAEYERRHFMKKMQDLESRLE
jgi:HK97 gp10 family phage protein